MSQRKLLVCLFLAYSISSGLGLWVQHSLDRTVIAGEFKNRGFSQQVLAMLVSKLEVNGTITFLLSSGLLAVMVFLIVHFTYERFAQQAHQAELTDLKRHTALIRTQEAVIFGLAKLADSRDDETGRHLERIATYSITLASALRRREEFRDIITPAFVQSLKLSSALHDIGKVGIEDAILRKPGQFTAEECRRMQEHVTIGEQCLHEIEIRLGQSNFLQMAGEIAAAHHERWDGRGYPRGLSGEQIPLSARLVAIADVYDALSSKRSYKAAFPHERCVEIIASESGGQFDPRLIEVFLEIEDNFRSHLRQFHGDRPATVNSSADSYLIPSPQVHLGAIN